MKDIFDSTKHNYLVKKFVDEHLSPVAMKNGEDGILDAMTVYITLTLGVLLLLKEHGFKPRDAVSMCDANFYMAIERFVEANK